MQAVGLQVFVDPFFRLSFGLCFDFAGVEYELVLHDDGHVAHPQFGFVRFDQSQFYLIVFL
jgi:hypothetical protein